MRKTIYCPHCRHTSIEIPPLPSDVLALVVCQSCREWSVLFKDRMIPLDKSLFSEGTGDAPRGGQLAEIMARLMQMGFFNGNTPDIPGSSGGAPAITDDEVAQFVAEGLPQLDDPAAFRKLFGG
ncbi:MAG: hypothetical protein GX580_08775 [Candidatus Hydrogenedens sp.]|nr:hypothetical protein [Candidatus Hydrogenedentota bacterium]NLF57719.1 hypothetical protein [Candidatus Hydrogenedens sp.]